MRCLKIAETQDLAICETCEDKDACKIYETLMQVKEDFTRAWNEHYIHQYTGTADIMQLRVKLMEQINEFSAEAQQRAEDLKEYNSRNYH